MLNISFKKFCACALVGSIFLSGCTAGAVRVNNSDPAKKISFSWWGTDSRYAYTVEGVETFESKNPDIDVEVKYSEWNGYEKRMQIYMESHTQADVMQINYGWLDIYSKDGNGFYNLYDLQDQIDLSNFDKADLQFGEVNGKLNALPIAFNTSCVYYNKAIYDKYQLEIPKDWGDLFGAAARMQYDGVYPLGVSKKQMFLMLIAYYEQETGKRMFSEDGKLLLDAAGMEQVLDFYKRLIDKKVIPPIDNWERSGLSDGTYAGGMFWISDTNSYCSAMEEAGLNPVLGEYIGVDGHESNSGWYVKPATMYAISNITDNPEESARLLDYLLSSEDMAMLQKTEKGIPVSKSAVKTLEEAGELSGPSVEANEKMLDRRAIMFNMIPVMENETVIDAFKEAADLYLFDKADIKETSKQCLEAMNAVINGTN